MYALILAGGRGTRFWPLSRRHLPKQCLSLDGGPTLIQRTLQRLSPDIPPERVLVLTGPDMAEAIRAQLPDLPPENILVEPSGRNTAPCVAYGAWEVQRRGGVMFAVLPSDHLIKDEAGFRQVLQQAIQAASQQKLVTIGIQATRPETGFGWIEPVGDGGGVQPVKRFVEKPPLVVAEQMLAGGRHLWNAGMFVWSVEQILREIHNYLPGCTRFLQQMDAGLPLSEAWPQCEATSIDYGVMERSKDVVVVPGNFGWSDVGSWPALAEVLPAAPYGWSVAEAVIAEAASGNVVHAPNKVVALVGVQDLIVVDTPDALLVAQMAQAQAIRNVIARLEQEGLERLT